MMLRGEHIQLEPLSATHVEPLVTAASESRETYGFTIVPDSIASMKSYVDFAIAEAEAGRAIPYAIRRIADDTVIGCTRFWDFASWSGRSDPDAVEIGHTWYAASAQRTACNTETKLLMLMHAFEVWEVVRVTLKTDARNLRSRKAIERIGGKFEGIRRAHQLASDGTVRDTAYFSIIAPEWPAARDRLRERLAA
ncbi:MAG TPA: GNAT family protein [Mycobacteriales bacterium]|nr:GNAT family protein [Mycobacteriales bacterium]